MRRFLTLAVMLLSFVLGGLPLYGSDATPSVYTVSEGDTLSQIALTQLGDARLSMPLARYNGLDDPDAVRTGRKLLVPDVATLLMAERDSQKPNEVLNELRQLRAELTALRQGLAFAGIGLAPIYWTRFEDDRVEAPPVGWEFPSGGKWRVVRRGTKVLEQYDRRGPNPGAVAGDIGWSNYVVRADIRIEHSGDAGIFVYWRSREQNYRLRTIDRFRRLQLTKREPRNGGGYDTRVLAQIPISLKESAWYTYKLQAENLASSTYLRAKIWRKGTPEPADWVLEAADDAANHYRAGKAGVWTNRAGSSYQGTQFDNFAVLALPGGSE